MLDFCDADNPHPVVEVELELGAGSAKLLVPDDATANVDDLVPGMGSVHSSVPSTPQPGHPHFVVHGRTAVGSVRCAAASAWGATSSERTRYPLP